VYTKTASRVKTLIEICPIPLTTGLTISFPADPSWPK
jgi:hypothetical protein